MDKIRYLKLGKDFDQDEEKTSETKHIYLFILSIACLAVSNSIIKNLKTVKNDHNEFSFLLDRYLFYAMINYLACRRNEIDLSGIQKEDIKWMLVRNLSLFFAFGFMTFSMDYLRLSTSICLLMISPLWLSILSVIFFNEKFSMKFFLGIGVCFVGTIFISINERSNINVGKNVSLILIFLGVLYGIASSAMNSLAEIASNKLGDKYDCNYVNLIFGVWSSIICFVIGIFTNNFISDSLNCVVTNHALINAIFSYFSLHYLNISCKSIESKKVLFLGYLQLIFSSAIGYFYFGEKLFFIDFLGASMIIGYNVYNVFGYSIK